MTTIKCQQCGKEFEPAKKNQRFCCSKCKDTYHNARKTAHSIEKNDLQDERPTKMYVDANFVNTLQHQLERANEKNTKLLTMFQDYMSTSVLAVDAIVMKVDALLNAFNKKRYNSDCTKTCSFTGEYELDGLINSVRFVIQAYNNKIFETELYQQYYPTEEEEYEDAEYEEKNDDEDDETEENAYDDAASGDSSSLDRLFGG